MAPNGRIEPARPIARLACVLSFLLVEAALACLPVIGLAPHGPGAAVIGLAAVVVFFDLLLTSHREQRSVMAWMAGLLIVQALFVAAATHVAGVALGLGLEDGLELPGIGWMLAAIGVAAPALLGVWTLLARWQLEPSLGAKCSLAFVGLAVGGLSAATGIELGASSTAAWLACGSLAIAGAVIGPACIGGLWQLSAARQRYAALSCWLLSLVCARSLGGWTLPLAPLDRGAAFDVCLGFGWVALTVAVLASLAWRPLANLRPAPLDGPTDAPAPTLATVPRAS